jgi:hypothetical protein
VAARHELRSRADLDGNTHFSSLWIALAAAPIVLASGISYRAVLPLRISLAGFPISFLDALIVLLFAAALATAPAQHRKTTSVLLLVAVVVAGMALAVGIVRENSMYFVLRDTRAALYFIAGVYLANLISRTPEMARAGLRLLALSALLAGCFQWIRFVSGLSYGREAELAGSGVLRDATIYQYTYALAFSVIAATYGTSRRLFDDRVGVLLLCLIVATVSITLTRSAWLALAFAALCAVLVPRGRAWRVRAVVVGSLSAAALPWLVLGATGSPLATLPINRLSAAGDLESAFSITATEPTQVINAPSAPAVTATLNVSPRLSPTPSGVSVATAQPSLIATPIATPQPSPIPSLAPAPFSTAPPTLTGRFGMATVALTQLVDAAAGPDGWSIWLFGFGFGHNLATYTFGPDETAVGVTDIENAPAHFLWKTGVVGLLLVTAAAAWQILRAGRALLRDQDPVVAGLLAAIGSVLLVITLTGVGGAPYTMAIGGWLGIKAHRSERA